MYETENELVCDSIPLIKDIFRSEMNDIKVIKEPKGLFGIPDILLYNGQVIAIEFKLKNWKQAMKQAFRYTSFSSEVYVIMDKTYANSAKENIEEFRKYNIGLGAVGDESMEIYHRPIPKSPFSYELREKAYKLFDNNL